MRSKQQIQREARAILVEFADRYPILGTIPIRVSARMTRAGGTAVFTNPAHEPVEIKLSLPFFADEANDLRETVTHEAAHIVAGRKAVHGPAWKAVHRTMGGKAQRCHKMELANGFTARRNVRVDSPCARCGRPLSLGPIQAKKANRGARYSHKNCSR